jgi:hypothetical protein
MEEMSLVSGAERTYNYSPLSKEGHIRCVRLVPGKDITEPIRCELIPLRLEAQSYGTYPYSALSYAWGNPEKKKVVYIGQDTLPVTDNLYSALLHLRNPYIERILWIDAMSINQSDLEERAQQVQQMMKIYSRAERVIVWLGEAADDSDRVLGCLRSAAERAVNSSKRNYHSKIHQDLFYLSPDHVSVSSFFQRQWFRRMWVSQTRSRIRVS